MDGGSWWRAQRPFVCAQTLSPGGDSLAQSGWDIATPPRRVRTNVLVMDSTASSYSIDRATREAMRLSVCNRWFRLPWLSPFAQIFSTKLHPRTKQKLLFPRRHGRCNSQPLSRHRFPHNHYCYPRFLFCSSAPQHPRRKKIFQATQSPYHPRNFPILMHTLALSSQLFHATSGRTSVHESNQIL